MLEGHYPSYALRCDACGLLACELLKRYDVRGRRWWVCAECARTWEVG